MQELKQCPFCGGFAQIADSECEFFAFCLRCKAHSDYYTKKEDAAESWNKRVEKEKVNPFYHGRDDYYYCSLCMGDLTELFYNKALSKRKFLYCPECGQKFR